MRRLLWWDVTVAGSVAVLCVPGGLGAFDWAPAREGWELRLGLALGVLGLFVVLYAVLGRPALRRTAAEEPLLPRDVVFLALLVVVVGLATAVNPSFAFLQAVSYPMIWYTAGESYRASLLWSAALALATGAGSAISYQRLDADNALWTGGVMAALSLAFAVAMGTWIRRISAQGETYREMAESLQRAQGEVARLSEAAGVAAERERLSRELHDTLTQTLTGLVMLSEQAERAFEAGEQERGRDRLARVEAAARDALSEARALVATTQPLGDGGLIAAIERVAARLELDAGMVVRCALSPLPLDREREVVLLRAAQEGLANARKHSRANEVRVTLAGGGGEARLLVIDDGVGPGSFSAAPAGFGLSGLSERLRAVGGEVRFGAGEGGGAVLEVRMPLGEAAGSDRVGQTAGDPPASPATRVGDPAPAVAERTAP